MNQQFESSLKRVGFGWVLGGCWVGVGWVLGGCWVSVDLRWFEGVVRFV